MLILEKFCGQLWSTHYCEEIIIISCVLQGEKRHKHNCSFFQYVLYLCHSHITFNYWRFEKEDSWLLPKFCEENRQFHRAAFPWFMLAFYTEVFVTTMLSSPAHLLNLEQLEAPCKLRWGCPAVQAWLCPLVWEQLPFSSWSWYGASAERSTPWLAPEQRAVFPPAPRLTDVVGWWTDQLHPACVFEELKRMYTPYFLWWNIAGEEWLIIFLHCQLLW